MQVGQTATLTLPETVYGGEVDTVTGEGQETWKVTTIDAKKSNSHLMVMINFGICRTTQQMVQLAHLKLYAAISFPLNSQ